MKTNLIKIILISLTAIITSSCASSRKVETAEIKSVRGFAVSGFSAALPFSTLTSNAGIKNSAEIDQMYDALNDKLAALLKAKQIKRSQLITNQAYVRAYDATMKGFQNKSINLSAMRYDVPQVMDKDGIRLLDVTGRDQLMKELNVDALVSVEVHVSYEGFSVMGIGTRKPKTQFFIQMFKKGGEAPVWFETIEGEASTESVGATSFINENKLRELSLASFKTALQKMKLE